MYTISLEAFASELFIYIYNTLQKNVNRDTEEEEKHNLHV